MRIIIVGAGDVGFHLAKLLSFEAQDIFLIDQDAERLEYVNNHLDVITIKGDATSTQLLRQTQINNTDLLLAVTESQNTNFTIAAIGKKLGAKKTIARISNIDFLNKNEIDCSSIGIDFMISPELLAAEEIVNLLHWTAFDDSIEFEDGALMILGGKLTKNSVLRNLTVQQVRQQYADLNFITISVKREHSDTTIIPRGDTVFHSGDHVYFSVPRESVSHMHPFIGKENIKVKDVMILGGSTIGKNTARMLSDLKMNLKLIEIDRKKAFEISEDLKDVLIINGDGRNVDLLTEENIADMDAFIAVTGNSETNIMSCLVAKTKGVKKTIALVENMDYINISQAIGIDTLINKKLLAASSIFKHVRKGKVVSMANTHSMDAEILEFEVRPDSYVTRKTIKNLNLSRDAVFSGVVRNDTILMPYGDFQIENGDKVIVFALLDAIHEVENLFNK